MIQLYKLSKWFYLSTVIFVGYVFMCVYNFCFLLRSSIFLRLHNVFFGNFTTNGKYFATRTFERRKARFALIAHIKCTHRSKSS